MNLLVICALITLGIERTAAQCCAVKGDTRVVKGYLDNPFSTEVMLPGFYDKLTSGIFTVNIKNGNCSTPFFTCQITQTLPNQAVANISGIMSFGLKRIYFFSSLNLVPINVIFLTNNYWNDLATSSVQYQYALPFVVPGKGRQTVTLTCSVFTLLSSADMELYYGVNPVAFYSNKASMTNPFPHVMNIDYRPIVFHEVITFTVSRKYPLDFYHCKRGVWFQTHMIDWNAEFDPSELTIFDALVGTFIGSNAGVKQDLAATLERIVLSILGDSSSNNLISFFAIGITLMAQTL